MTVSQKQLDANKKNAQKGGVKTPKGKAITRYNALKHGLLAKEVVVATGEGAEDPAEFDTLCQDLKGQLRPDGTVEEMLVEKIIVAYWRLRRAYRYESGLIRRELDSAADGFYEKTGWNGEKPNKTDEQIDAQIRQEQEGIAYWQHDRSELTTMHEEGKPLESIYDWEENWEYLEAKVDHLLPEESEEVDTDGDFGPQELRTCLNRIGWSDDHIWKALIDGCAERASQHQKRIEALESEKQKNHQKIAVLKTLGSVPSRHELDRLLRYEGAIERQFYRALNELERLQRLRAGDDVPAPVEVDVDVSSGEAV